MEKEDKKLLIEIIVITLISLVVIGLVSITVKDENKTYKPKAIVSLYKIF